MSTPVESLRQRLVSALVEAECMRNDRGAWVRPNYDEAGRMADLVALVLGGAEPVPADPSHPAADLDPTYLAQERGEAPDLDPADPRDQKTIAEVRRAHERTDRYERGAW